MRRLRARALSIGVALLCAACSRDRSRPSGSTATASTGLAFDDVKETESAAPSGLVAPPLPTRTAPPSAAPSVARAPRKTPRARRGLWIWEFNEKGPSPERSADLAASLGVYRVFIKGGNGNSLERWKKNASPENLAPFLERGFEVWLFGYFYAEGVADLDGRTWGTLDEQIAAIAPVANQPGIHGLVVDVEEEFKGKAGDAERLCKGLRAKLPGRAIAYTTFGWLSAHRAFPYATFDKFCGDAFLPQVYWAFGWAGGIEGSMARLERDVKSMGLKAPVWPVQSNEPDPDPTALTAFFERAGDDASLFYLHRDDENQTARLGAVVF
ncbi:MAG: hypothetical protein U0271_00115 [Polyangiaceae bacterium]